MGKRKSRQASGHLPSTVSQEPAQLNSDPSAAGPYAVYFPSGFDPATGMAWDTLVDPRKRQSLVVGRTENVDFVGGSASDVSGAMPPPCKYALGVYDPASGRLCVAPVSHGRLLRMDPRVRGVSYGPSGAGAGSDTDRKAAGMRLVEALGSQRRRRQLLAREAARVDPGQTVSGADMLRAQVRTSGPGGLASPNKEDLIAAALAGRPLPPHDAGATTPAAAYPLRSLVWDAVWDAVPAAAYASVAVDVASGTTGSAEDCRAALRLTQGLTLQSDYVAGRLAARGAWQQCEALDPTRGRQDRARLLALLDALLTLARRWSSLRGGGGGRQAGSVLEALAVKTGIPAPLLTPLLAKFYEHHAPHDAGEAGPSAERWVLPAARKELLLNWALAVAVRAEPGAAMDAPEVTALATELGLKPAALAERARELGAVTPSVGGARATAGRRIVLLPKTTEPRTLASYFPELKAIKKSGQGRG